jgi:hypothetical protein
MPWRSSLPISRIPGLPGHLLNESSKEGGRIYQQTFIDAQSKVVCAKLCTTKTPIANAGMLYDCFLPLDAEVGWVAQNPD